VDVRAISSASGATRRAYSNALPRADHLPNSIARYRVPLRGLCCGASGLGGRVTLRLNLGRGDDP
jgi:hypothetical protein